VYWFLAAASHGVLDALTNRGLGSKVKSMRGVHGFACNKNAEPLIRSAAAASWSLANSSVLEVAVALWVSPLAPHFEAEAFIAPALDPANHLSHLPS
jgi:hypothetical protein